VKARDTDHEHMSYAIVWQEEDGTVYTGKLELNGEALQLDGLSRVGEHHLRTLRYADVAGIHTGRGQERIGGRPTLVLDQAAKPPVRIGSVGGSGLLSEVAEQLIVSAFAA
jgi:hypothetical protein